MGGNLLWELKYKIQRFVSSFIISRMESTEVVCNIYDRRITIEEQCFKKPVKMTTKMTTSDLNWFFARNADLSIWFNVVSHAKTNQLLWKSILISIASYKVILSSFGQIAWFKTVALFWWSSAQYRAEKLQYVENCTRTRWELIKNWDNDLEEFKGQFWQCILMQKK